MAIQTKPSRADALSPTSTLSKECARSFTLLRSKAVTRQTGGLEPGRQRRKMLGLCVEAKEETQKCRS